MSDRFLIDLAPGWALLFDVRQWILGRAEKKPLEGEKSPPGMRFRGIDFIGSTKAVLCRCLRENGVVPSPEGRAALDALPDTFKAWLRWQKTANANRGADLPTRAEAGRAA